MIAPGNRLRDDLVKQLFNDLGTPPPVPGLTFNAPGFVAPNTGALGAGRGPSGGVPPPSGAGPSSGGSVTSQRPAPWKRSGLPPAPPIEGELVGSRPVGGSPAPVPVGPSPVKGALPPPSMIPLAASSTWPDVERPQIVRLGSGEAVPVGDKPNRMAPVGVVPAQNAEPAAGTPEFKVGFGKDLKLFRTAKPGSPDQTAALDRIITKIQQSPKPPSVTSFDPYKGTEVEGYDVFPPKGGVPKNFWPEFYAEHKLRLTPEVKAQLQHIHEGLENFQFEQGYHQTEYDPTGTFQTGEIEGFRTPWTPYKRMIEEFAPAAPARREPRGMDFAKTTEVAGQKSLQAVNQLLANGRVDNNLKLGALRLAESLVKEGGFDAMLQPLNRAAVKPAYGADNFSPEMFEDK